MRGVGPRGCNKRMLRGYSGWERGEEETFAQSALGKIDGGDGGEEVFHDRYEDGYGGKLSGAAIGDAEGRGEFGLRW